MQSIQIHVAGAKTGNCYDDRPAEKLDQWNLEWRLLRLTCEPDPNSLSQPGDKQRGNYNRKRIGPHKGEISRIGVETSITWQQSQNGNPYHQKAAPSQSVRLAKSGPNSQRGNLTHDQSFENQPLAAKVHRQINGNARQEE